MTTPSSIEERLAGLEGSYEQIDRRLGTLEQDVRGLRSDISTLATEFKGRMDQVNGRMDQMNGRMGRLLYWQLGLLGAIAASIVVTVLTRLL
jgi:hypothetical protein